MGHEIPDYTYGLCSCCGDCGVCCYACCCLCCATASNWAAIRSEQCDCCYLCGTPSPYWTRQFIRSRKHFERNDCGDRCIMCCCLCCAVTQDGREIKEGGCGMPDCEYYYNKERYKADKKKKENNDDKEAQYDAPSPSGYYIPPPL